MSVMSELQETATRLDENGKILLLEIAKRFLANDSLDDVLSESDLQLISQAEEEYANGETISHNDRAWK